MTGISWSIDEHLESLQKVFDRLRPLVSAEDFRVASTYERGDEYPPEQPREDVKQQIRLCAEDIIQGADQLPIANRTVFLFTALVKAPAGEYTGYVHEIFSQALRPTLEAASRALFHKIKEEAARLPTSGERINYLNRVLTDAKQAGVIKGETAVPLLNGLESEIEYWKNINESTAVGKQEGSEPEIKPVRWFGSKEAFANWLDKTYGAWLIKPSDPYADPLPFIKVCRRLCPLFYVQDKDGSTHTIDPDYIARKRSQAISGDAINQQIIESSKDVK